MRAQLAIALSSGESEFVAMVAGCSEGLLVRLKQSQKQIGNKKALRVCLLLLLANLEKAEGLWSLSRVRCGRQPFLLVMHSLLHLRTPGGLEHLRLRDLKGGIIAGLQEGDDSEHREGSENDPREEGSVNTGNMPGR